MELKTANMPWDTGRLRIPFRFSGYSSVLRVAKIGLTRSVVSLPLKFSNAAQNHDQFNEE